MGQTEGPRTSGDEDGSCSRRCEDGSGFGCVQLQAVILVIMLRPSIVWSLLHNDVSKTGSVSVLRQRGE